MTPLAWKGLQALALLLGSIALIVWFFTVHWLVGLATLVLWLAGGTLGRTAEEITAMQREKEK